MTGLDRAVREAQIIVCTGSGGVGKTTTAAALGLEVARLGRRTVVVTIDPARRLAQSLGLEALDNTPRRVAGVDGLDAMMLDMKQTFDEIVERHAATPAQAERIKGNRFYQQMSDTLAGTQEYMAMEKLYDLHATGHYDCIVVDTPPTRNALDFLDAPKRLTDFLEGRFLKMFLSLGSQAGRRLGRVATFSTSLFMKAASRITGAGVLDDLAEFFQSFEGLYEGFKQRAGAVHRLLASGSAAFVVVASPEAAALREARYFVQRLEQDGMPLAGVVVNRVTPPASSQLAAWSLEGVRAAADALAAGGERETAVAGLLRLHLDRVAVHARQQRAIAAGLYGVSGTTLVQVPQVRADVHALADLRTVGAHLVAS